MIMLRVVEREAWDWIQYWGGLIGALAASTAVVYAVVAVKRTDKALARERRIAFELDVLRELADLNFENANSPYVARRLKIRAALLSNELVPLSRAAVGLRSTPAAAAHVAAHQADALSIGVPVRVLVQDDIEHEILAAIELRVSQRA